MAKRNGFIDPEPIEKEEQSIEDTKEFQNESKKTVTSDNSKGTRLS